jgi:hypothetical protein
MEVKMEIDKEEYEVLRFAYEEWTKINRLIATFSFIILAFTLTGVTIYLKNVVLTSAHQSDILIAIKSFVWAGALAGINMCVAYIWMEAVRRAYKKSLVGKAAIGNYPAFCLKLGSVGWFLSVSALLLIVVV